MPLQTPSKIYGPRQQSSQGLQYQQTESLDTTECMTGEQRPLLEMILCACKPETVCFAHVREGARGGEGEAGDAVA